MRLANWRTRKPWPRWASKKRPQLAELIRGCRLIPRRGDYAGLSPELLKDLVGSDRRIAFEARVKEGSNNWVVSGKLTATGKPILANDPHRILAEPSLRYIVHLVAPGWNVI